MMNNIANSIEIEKIRPYWRAKGFTRPEDFSTMLERNDCKIVYRYRSWQMIENGETKAKAKSHRLYNLLSSIT
ncbi:hypothetical protein N5C89_16510 [Klebsiella michiganensis]|uniref:Uncharacterized protein n=1 Tax=Klebsiella michiganensis TaxID=1134687 RepID=A0AAJ1NVH2_9ENTR|nr:hypothetical protein [Klebsiella michiganensis]MDH0964441.1 hypothetical protein [Klebsiella michiganensis]